MNDKKSLEHSGIVHNSKIDFSDKSDHAEFVTGGFQKFDVNGTCGKYINIKVKEHIDQDGFTSVRMNTINI